MALGGKYGPFYVIHIGMVLDWPNQPHGKAQEKEPINWLYLYTAHSFRYCHTLSLSHFSNTLSAKICTIPGLAGIEINYDT